MQRATTTDGQLLDCFVRERDPGAFRRLVTRHGPTVLQVCRGVLHDAHDVEDAFQATFLVLVRRAPSIRNPEALGGWLRGVALRTALRARCRAARRRVIERTRAELFPPIVDSPEALAPEMRQIIRAELDRLPDDYRQAITLCYLESLTHQEAARRLGWPVGTVKVRLVRGRRLLRERLARRGVCLGAALLLWLLDPKKAAAVPEPLVDSTIRALDLAAAGRHAALQVTCARALEIADAITGRGFRSHLPWTLAVVAVIGILFGVSGPVALAFQSPPAQTIDPHTLPSNLVDVLGVDCS